MVELPSGGVSFDMSTSSMANIDLAGDVVAFCPEGPEQANLLQEACREAGFIVQLLLLVGREGSFAQKRERQMGS
ncbi:hypothetical protein HPP92_026808 [Vanilla planifolia]|uniref:Uncharacterized protein n=1 Tax=Vanilla planifolia TaxID=51239 RepID=A0A835U6P2_VANPL|nr:hypothetical protein HPP92_026808 [Vanilla planifolia]